MAGQQRTFQLIPETLAKSNVPIKAMTSKQAKKAYQKRSIKGPKVPRAEQARLDKEELERQKIEYERERASRKAKAVRDKKAQKAEEEKAERKRKGLPEPNRYVRASQPRISMFVSSGKGNKRSWKQIDEVTEDTEDASDATVDCQERPPPAKRIAADDNSDDEFGDFPSLSQTDGILDKLDSSALDEVIKFNAHIPKLPSLKANLSTTKDCNPNLQDDDLDILVTAQLLSETDDAIQNALSSPPIGNKNKMGENLGIDCQKGQFRVSRNHEPQESQEAPRSPLEDMSINMAPSALSNKTAKPISFAEITAECENTIQKSFIPSATQAFLESHLDDFFPSPSQEVRELLEDIDNSSYNPQVTKELDDNKFTKDDPWGDMYSTQDLVLSPQDLLEITTPSRASPKLSITRESPLNAFQSHNPAHSMNHPAVPKPQLNRDALIVRKRPEISSRLSHVAQTLNDEAPIADIKQEFTIKSKAPQLLNYDARATPLQKRDVIEQQLPTYKKRNIQAPALSTYQRRRFFEEKEEDLIHAALHESKAAPRVELNKFNHAPITEATKSVPVNGAARSAPRRDISKSISIKEAPNKSTRTFQRIQSTATDYGDEEFNEQDLLALC